MNGKGDVEYCRTKCETGAQLHDIGQMLDKKVKINKKCEKVKKQIPKSEWIEILKKVKDLVEKGESKRAAAASFGISAATLYEWETKCNFDIGGRRRRTFSDSEQLEMLKKAKDLLENGMYKKEAAAEIGIDKVTLLKWEKKHKFYLHSGERYNRIEILEKAAVLIKSGISKSEAAKELGIDKSTLRNWERDYNFNLQGGEEVFVKTHF